MWVVSKSNIDGQGIFASENIKKGSVIGHAYDLIGEVNNSYIAGDITILGSLHNHSPIPSAIPELYDNKIYFEALEDISKGSEITCNYNEYSNVLNIEKPLNKWQESDYEN